MKCSDLDNFKNEISTLKMLLNDVMTSEGIRSERTLQVSQKLDDIIIKYYKAQMCSKK